MEATTEEQSWIMLSENLQRKDLSEVEKAETIKELLSSQGTKFTIREAASKLGIGKSYLDSLLNLAGYPTEVKAMVKSEKITAYQARPLAQLGSKHEPPTEQLQVKVAEHIRDNHLNYDGAKEVVQRVNDLPKGVREILDVSEVKVSDVIIAITKLKT